MQQIFNSHYVPLQPPYPVIYCNGEVGMQIGTLIVIEKPDVKDPRLPSHWNTTSIGYRIHTHSHPVVSYGNKSAGLITPNVEPNDWSECVVWDNVESRDVITLCHAPNGIPNDPPTENVPGNTPWIHVSTLQNVYLRLNSLIPQERLRDLFSNQQRFSLSKIVRSLMRIIPADLSLVNFEPTGSLMLQKGGLRPGESSIISNHIMNLPCLYIAIKQQDTLGANFEAVKMQVEDYLNAVSANHDKVQIEFGSHDEELKPLIALLNEAYFKPKL